MTAMPLQLEDGSAWDPGRGTVTSNCEKVWLPTDHEPNLDLRKPVRFHQQRKSKVDHDPDASGTRIKVHDVQPGWLLDPEADDHRHEHLTTTNHDDCKAHVEFIRARRLSELLVEAERIQQGKSNRIGGSKGDQARLRPVVPRAKRLKRTRAEKIVGQLCTDERLGSETEKDGWRYVWKREETLMCHLRDVDQAGVVTVRPGMEDVYSVILAQTALSTSDTGTGTGSSPSTSAQ